MAFDEAVASRIRMLLAVHTGGEAEERRMFGGLAFMAGGGMCCGVMGAEIIARVPRDFYDEALTLPGVRPFDFTGRPMRGFVCVSAALQDDGMLLEWLERGIQAAAAGGKSGRRKPSRTALRPKWAADF